MTLSKLSFNMQSSDMGMRNRFCELCSRAWSRLSLLPHLHFSSMWPRQSPWPLWTTTKCWFDFQILNSSLHFIPKIQTQYRSLPVRSWLLGIPASRNSSSAHPSLCSSSHLNLLLFQMTLEALPPSFVPKWHIYVSPTLTSNQPPSPTIDATFPRQLWSISWTKITF